ncbi:MAG: hypothetical protein ABIY70_13630 [Capsulimonas sp.]|uniref:hypothetical protein n=1 Tax=Capsulimonas sp. TaxID=2494211 RepID=UPI0032677429
MSFSDHHSELAPTLRRMFGALVERAFIQTMGVYEPGVTDYLAGVLTDFAHFQNVYKVRDLQGKPLQEVADMLIQADIRLDAPSFNREREVHKHIGDFTLFWAGVYPESLKGMHSRWRKDHLLDYVQQGRNSYAIAATHDYGEYREQAPVLKKLSEEFELCLYGMSLVRGDIDGMARA